MGDHCLTWQRTKSLSYTLVPVLERRSRSCSVLTDRDLKADVHRNRFWACDVDLGRPLRRRSNVLLVCANRVRRRLITLCETPKRLATVTCLIPDSSIPIARKRASFGRCRRCGILTLVEQMLSIVKQ